MKSTADLSSSPFASSLRAGRPLSYGILEGDEMRVDWAIYPVKPDGRHSIEVISTFKNDGFKCSGAFEMDAIAFSRRIGDEDAWRKHILDMVRVSVASAVKGAASPGTPSS